MWKFGVFLAFVFVVLLRPAAFAAEPPKPPADQAYAQPAADELPIHLIKVLRTTNKAQTNRYVPKVYDIANVNPFELFRWIRRTAQIEDGSYYFFGKPDAQGIVNAGKIVVILPEYMIPGVDEMMKIIDRPGLNSGAGDTWFYFRPKHRSASDTGFVNVLQTIRGNSADTVADPETNMIVVYAPLSKVDDIKRFFDTVDTPPPQVVVEVAVYEVYVDNEARLGLDYVAWKNGPGRNLFAAGAFFEKEKVPVLHNSTPLLNTGTGGTYGLPGHGFQSSGANFSWFLDVPSAFFDFLVVKNKARVMTAAKIAARNLIPATLSSGDTILYYNTRLGTATSAGIRPAGTPLDPTGASAAYPDNRTVVGTQTTRYLAGKSGVSLQVTPTIGDSEVNLRVIASVVSHTGFDDKGAPTLVARTADTEVRARDGQEIILGGYSREMLVERSDKMPFFGSLPFIGYLFGGEGTTTQRTQVVLVLTPHVVTDFSAMNYKPTQIDAALIQNQAERKVPAKVPETEAGFDQWILDAER